MESPSWKTRYKKYNKTMLRAAQQGRIETAFFLWLIRRMEPCADCGERFPDHPERMEFDHVRPVLRRRVTSISCWTWLIAELGQCEIVCANCHRTRTLNRGQQVQR